MSHVAWPAGVEPEVPVPGYPNTWTHTPARAPFPRAPGLTELSAPPALRTRPWTGVVELASPR